MSFKDNYKKSQQNVAPDEEFLRTLADKMELQKKKKKTLRLIMTPSAAFVGFAAVIALFVNFSKDAATNLPILGTDKDNISYQQGIFVQGSVFDSEDDIPQQLAEKLCNNATVVYESTEKIFSDDNKISYEQRLALAETISNAAETNLTQEEVEAYYMAVFEDGSVLKFTIGGSILAVDGKCFEI